MCTQYAEPLIISFSFIVCFASPKCFLGCLRFTPEKRRFTLGTDFCSSFFINFESVSRRNYVWVLMGRIWIFMRERRVNNKILTAPRGWNIFTRMFALGKALNVLWMKCSVLCWISCNTRNGSFSGAINKQPKHTIPEFKLIYYRVLRAGKFVQVIASFAGHVAYGIRKWIHADMFYWLSIEGKKLSGDAMHHTIGGDESVWLVLRSIQLALSAFQNISHINNENITNTLSQILQFCGMNGVCWWHDSNDTKCIISSYQSWTYMCHKISVVPFEINWISSLLIPLSGCEELKILVSAVIEVPSTSWIID